MARHSFYFVFLGFMFWVYSDNAIHNDCVPKADMLIWYTLSYFKLVVINKFFYSFIYKKYIFVISISFIRPTLLSKNIKANTVSLAFHYLHDVMINYMVDLCLI